MIQRDSSSVNVSNINSSAYGEIVASQLVPQVTGSAIYNFIPSNFRTFLAGNGTAIAEDNIFKVTSGDALGHYGTIRSFRSLNYKTGQGAHVRMCARFLTPQANSWSGCGAINLGDELSFGYNGLEFGIWHRYNGRAEVRDLQITTPAGGSETASITINGVLYSVPITSGTVQDNAYEIEQYLLTNGAGFEVEQIDDIVRIDFTSDGAKSGTYSFSSTGSAIASFSQVTAGVTKTSDHIPQSDWNGYIFSELDPSKGNTYEITYHNGYGDMYFYIEDSRGDLQLVHTERWSNRKISPNLANPSIHVGVYATSIGATTPVEVECPYLAGFVSGVLSPTRNPRAEDNTKSIDTTLTNILTLKNSRTYNGIHNQVEIAPRSITLTNDGNKGAIFELRANPTVAGPTNFQEVGNNLISQKDVSGGTVTENGRYLGSWAVARLSSLTVDLNALNIRQPPSLRLVLCGKMTSGSPADLSATIVWYEDI
jgi:hypothetical protein